MRYRQQLLVSHGPHPLSIALARAARHAPNRLSSCLPTPLAGAELFVRTDPCAPSFSFFLFFFCFYIISFRVYY